MNYTNLYFQSHIFNYNYKPIGAAIFELFHPKSILEFGCGDGNLTRVLQKEGISITALDGFSQPDFSKFRNISFHKLDLNNVETVNNFIKTNGKKYDLAICMEVAEHLKPEVSENLIEWLASSADRVIFSASVTMQGGEGHINCRNRLFWNDLFEKKSFFLNDVIRKSIRKFPDVGIWYRLNTLVYEKKPEGLTLEDYKSLTYNLIESDSEASSLFYKEKEEKERLLKIFEVDIIKLVFNFRNALKRIFGLSVIKLK